MPLSVPERIEAIAADVADLGRRVDEIVTRLANLEARHPPWNPVRHANPTRRPK